MSAQAPSSRTILTWNGTTGVPFEWGELTSAEKNTLDFGDATPTANRVAYLRGDRTNEIGNAAGAGLFRQRDGVLADVVDSSPQWVGPPSAPYTSNWQDRLYPYAALPENAVANSYLAFVKAEQTRLNVVYVGANDGLLHGFRAGSFDANGNYVDNSSTPNDGREVLAYMPAGVLQSAPSFSNAYPTQSVVQNIHGFTPGNAAATPATVDSITSGLDFTGTQYGHNFFVDATPGNGDLFYASGASSSGAWHSWLVSGLGAGGAAIFALDITNPGSFSEGNASATVIGEWNSATISCANVANCGNSLGNTYGTPQIRRLHDGNWGVVFGNGFGSANGDAGIYVMSVDQATGTPTFYYLSAGAAGANGIAYVATVDLDGDHITDYVYAGDLQGNVWRFDLTSNNPANWAAGAMPLFQTQAGQPITSSPVVAAIPSTGGAPRVLVAFGTGARTQLTNLSPTTYASGTQSLYGVWDWNMGAWNALSTIQYASLNLPATTLSVSNLTAQTLTYVPSTTSWDGTNNGICWKGLTLCSAGNTQFGWYLNLQGASEQIIYNPTLYSGAFIVDSVVPANNIPTQCATNLDTGFTYAIAASNGGALTQTINGLKSSAFPQYNDPTTVGVQTNATGTPYIVNTAEGTANLVYQTVAGQPCNGGNCTQFQAPANTKASRLTWIELR